MDKRAVHMVEPFVGAGYDLQAEASRKAAEIETEFDEAKLDALVEAGGKAA